MSFHQGSIEPSEYRSFCDFLHDAVGIELGENKHYLVLSRLSRLVKEFQLETVGHLLTAMRNDVSLRARVIEAMMTHETFWFRDNTPFDNLRNLVLPEIAARRPCVRLWSAACSHGQEPYSIAMTIAELQRSRPGVIRQADILGTDIAAGAIAHATAGVYNDLAVARGLSSEMQARYLGTADGGWQVREDIRRWVRFQRFNLLNSFALLGRFDVIFCRNVLIYFSEKVKRDIVTRLVNVLLPGGYLFLGSSESLLDYPSQLEIVRCRPGLAYRRVPPS